MSTRLLLVEDHLPLRLSLSASLRKAGYEVTAVASAEEADQVVQHEPPHVVVLDWMLPLRSGVDVLRDWRARGLDVPVIMLTARDTIDDRVKGLDAGAQDYLVKPFATEELLARLRVQLRDRGGDVLRLTGVDVDLGRHQAERDGQTVPLTTKEAELLAYLAARPSRAVSRDELLRQVFGYAPGVASRTVDNTMLRLRSKLELDPAQPRHLVTVHGTGYRFEP